MRSQYNGNGNGDGTVGGNRLPVWLKDPFFREIYESRSHQVRA